MLDAVVGRRLAADVWRAGCERDAKIGVLREAIDCGEKTVFALNHFRHTWILAGPHDCRAVTWTIDQQRQANRGAVSELTRKRHLHVDAVARVKRHRNE